jgi:hypothetical protein
MRPIEIAHALAQQEASARGQYRRPAPVLQDPWTIVPWAAPIPTSAVASTVMRADLPPTSTVRPPKVTAIKKRRRRSIWARALRNHRLPTGTCQPGLLEQ